MECTLLVPNEPTRAQQLRGGRQGRAVGRGTEIGAAGVRAAGRSACGGGRGRRHLSLSGYPPPTGPGRKVAVSMLLLRAWAVTGLRARLHCSQAGSIYLATALVQIVQVRRGRGRACEAWEQGESEPTPATTQLAS